MNIDLERPYAGAEESESKTLTDYLAILSRRRTVILGVTLLALVFALVSTLLAPPVYRSSALISVDKTPPVVLLDSSRSGLFANSDVTAASGGVMIAAELGRSAEVRQSAIARLAPELGSAAAQAMTQIRVQPVRGADLVRVSVDHTDPEVAALAANAVADSLVEQDAATRRARTTEVRAFIETQMARTREQLHVREDALAAFKKRNGSVSLAEETTLALNTLADLENKLIDVRLQRQQAQARIRLTRAQLATQARITPTQWSPSPVIHSLQNQLASAEIELAALQQQFTDQHPAVGAARARIAEIQRKLDAEIARAPQPQQFGVDPVYQQMIQQVWTAEIDAATLAAREAALGGAIRTYAARIRAVPDREVALARLTRNVREAEQNFLQLSQRLQEARLAEASIGSIFRVSVPAQVPFAPVRPNPISNALLGALLGVMTGIAAAFVLERLDTERSAEDIERRLRIPVLAQIPAVGHQERATGRAVATAGLIVILAAGAYLLVFVPRLIAGL
ncbi:MAG: GumC family protein [Armatimonadota bacterium]|nr:GumC family protein [Armatimonadota bacterium]MDR5697432.1 GumC family protein [Armatimonadota bacterium]